MPPVIRAKLCSWFWACSMVMVFMAPAGETAAPHDAGTARSDGEDGDIGRGLDLLQALVEGDFGEGIAARRNQDDDLRPSMRESRSSVS